MKYRILELFSGIGGMHYAFKYSQLPGEVVAAIDINTVANAVYAHNHASTPVLNNNIQSLTAKRVQKLDLNMLLMSPPCQPHTRVGNQRDIADNRSDALEHICTLLPQCTNIKHILMENVKGFEKSQARQNFLDALEKAGFYWREFILSPTQIQVPNTRHRYYCIARKSKDFTFGSKHIINIELPFQPVKENIEQCTPTIESLLETDVPAETFLQDKVLNKRAWLLDIVTTSATNTMCFTKAYTHYAEGTGSIFTPLSDAEMSDIFGQVKRLEEENVNMEDVKVQRSALLKSLKLRYFTPREVARLMSFPECFQFPVQTTNKQRYRLLGNSINVCVVGELIKLLCS